MTVATQPSSLAERLKADTASLHERAERHPAMRGLMTGTMPIAALVMQLGQMMLVHQALEQALRANAGTPAIAAVYKPYHDRAGKYAADVKALGGNPASITATPSTARVIAAIKAAEPTALIGYFYVLEGSTNGAKFIGAALARAYSLLDRRGLSAQDPHGDKQQERWQAFKSGLAGVELTGSQADAVVAAANEQFGHVISLMDEMVAAYPVPGR